MSFNKTEAQMFDLSCLPSEETETIEYKSSRTSPKDLAVKIGRAVSGFANSGGGIFVAGVDEKTASADGGLDIDNYKGRQSLAEWIDQAVCEVKPTPKYHVELVRCSGDKGTIDNGKAVVVLYIEESEYPPHMAPDHRYYIRAGRNTVSATHFIVESLVAKRHQMKPRLTHLVRSKPDDDEAVQIGSDRLDGCTRH